MYDLLTEPLIGVRTPQGHQRLNLPELLAALSAGKVEGYTGLRAHQADPWHVFLVQLAASIQARHPTDRLPADPGYWRRGLLDLAEGMETAWHLVVEDVTQPAFFQHPWCSSAKYKPCAYTPDEFDVLFISRNHDVKSARIAEDELEAWIYALMTRQTITPYGGGAGTYNGIARMNSGSGSRPIVAWVRDLRPSQRFCDETHELSLLRKTILAGSYGYKARGVVLTWIHPWNHDQHQFFLKDLEPWFIEAPRLVRLRMEATKNSIIAWQAGSGARQIGPKEPHKGDVGDPWIPITTEGTALTVQKPGFTPKLLCRVIFKQGIQPSTGLLEPRSADAYGWLVASVLASGGNCKTDGFYRVELPVPSKVRISLLNRDKRDTLAHLAQRLLNDAESVQTTLSLALEVLLLELARKFIGSDGSLDRDLATLLEAKKDKNKKPSFDRIKLLVGSVKDEFIKAWEQRFFPTLWRGADEAHEAIRSDWQQQLVNMAQDLLDAATQRLPLPTNRTWRAVTQAHRAFRGMLRKNHLPMPGQATEFDANTMEETTT